MNRFKFLMMTTYRARLSLFTAFAVAVSVLVSGISVTYADQTPDHHTKRKELMDSIAAKRAADGDRARAKRADLLKQKKAAKEYMRKVVEGQQSGAGATAPDTGGAK